MGLGSRSESCCCCMGVKAGTLILLYLDLFAVIVAIITVFNGTQTGGNASPSFNDYDSKNNRISAIGKELGSGLVISLIVLLVIIIAGLFAVGKKKPTLLIPYFIIRIILTIVVALFLAPFIFLEKKGLDFLDTPKSYNNVYSDVTGDNNNEFGKSLSTASYALYGLIAFEIFLILLQIHYTKVVYACYKKIEEELAGSRGIIFPSQFPTCDVPYVPVHQQSINMIPRQDPSVC